MLDSKRTNEKKLLSGAFNHKLAPTYSHKAQPSALLGFPPEADPPLARTTVFEMETTGVSPPQMAPERIIQLERYTIMSDGKGFSLCRISEAIAYAFILPLF